MSVACSLSAATGLSWLADQQVLRCNRGRGLYVVPWDLLDSVVDDPNRVRLSGHCRDRNLSSLLPEPLQRWTSLKLRVWDRFRKRLNWRDLQR